MDIVERLRGNADERLAGWQIVVIMHDAADEIERLREALLPFTRLTVDNEVLEEWERKHPAFAQLVKNARSALKGDE